MHAGAAADDVGSIRVLQKCGFAVTGHARDRSIARGGEVDVVLLTLGPSGHRVESGPARREEPA